MEIWKKCPSWPRHEVSNLGNVRSTKYDEPRPMRLKVCTNGYRSTTDWLVHRLVAEAFLPAVANMPVVNHLNGDKADNRVENLEWSTLTLNNRHANTRGVRHALTNPKRAHKLTAAIVSEIRAAHKETGRTKEIAERFKLSTTMVQRIVYGRAWIMPIP